MTDKPEAIGTTRQRLFKIPIFAWVFLILWITLNLLGLWLSHAPINGYILGQFVGRSIFPFIFAWLLVLPVWFLSRRSQKAAGITFNIVFVVCLLSLWFEGIKKSAQSNQHVPHITNDGSGQRVGE